MEPVVQICSQKAVGDDRSYWLTRTVQERLDALEEIRETHILTLPEAERHFQRVCKITNHVTGQSEVLADPDVLDVSREPPAA